MEQILRDGFEALENGQVRAARECVRQVLSARPGMAQAHYLAGLIARRMKDRRTAVRAFGNATRLDPTHPAAHAHLAQIFMMAGTPNQGFNALKLAVRHENGDALVQNLIGNVYFRLGDQAAALEWYAKAAAGQPNNPGLLVDHANSLKYHGRKEQAETEIRKALNIQDDIPQAHWILSGLRQANSDAHVLEMNELAARAGLHPRESAFLHYAMGKELEDLERWVEAFEAYQEGARDIRSITEYDENSEIEMFEALQHVYTQEWLEGKSPGSGDPSPIFIVGQPRTGSTLLERVITSHSQVHSAGELRHFGIAVRRLATYTGPNRHSAELAQQAAAISGAELARFYLDASRHMRGNLPRFVDKMPLNFQYLPLILCAFPGAKIIHLIRNPLDACFSSFKYLFADAYQHSYAQREMVRHHLRYLKLMDTWRRRFPGRFLDVAYEDIARDLEPHARAVIDYLELPWEEACLRFYKQDTAVTTASAMQVREPPHTRSIGRWKRYQTQLRPMTDEFSKHGFHPEDLQ